MEVYHMKTKKLVLLFVAALLSLTLMGCPKVQNRIPEIVKIVDGEIVKINSITYEHVRGTDFHPDSMIQDLIDNQDVRAIDYDQSKMILGKDRDYFDISSNMEVISFYEIWTDGDDANNDGVVDIDDEEFYGLIKTDDDGNKLYDQNKIFLVEILGVGSEIDFTIVVTDDEGASTEISGTIVIVAAQE